LLKSAALVPPALAFSVPAQEAGFSSRESTFTFNVADHGAKGNGIAKDTGAIQSAIDAAGKAGGTVYIPPGNYLSGTLHLRSFVTLYLSPGSALLASLDSDAHLLTLADIDTNATLTTMWNGQRSSNRAPRRVDSGELQERTCFVPHNFELFDRPKSRGQSLLQSLV